MERIEVRIAGRRADRECSGRPDLGGQAALRGGDSRATRHWGRSRALRSVGGHCWTCC